MTPVLAVRSDTPSLGDALAQFRDAIKNAGLEPPEVIEPDSKLHRFSANGKRGDDAGWYVLHADGIPAGAFGDWRSGLSETWRADIGRKLTPAEEAAHRARLDAIRREREVEDAKRKAEAQAQAAAIWQAARPATEHPYLIAKGVASYGLRLDVGRLVIPLRDSEGVLHSLQFIAHDGEKRFLPGGHVKGGYFAIGKPNGTLCIAEGYATAASIHEATRHAVAVAFNAGNLLPVALALRAKYPELRIIVCADNDQWTEGNPGVTKAREAAETVGGLLAMPSFRDIATKPTDFNDLAKLEGPEAVRRCIEQAQPLAKPEMLDGKEDWSPSLRVYELGEFIALDIPPREKIFDPWLLSQSLNMVYSWRGVGKTHFALGVAYAVASGGEFLGWRAPKPQPVLYLDGEMPAVALQERLARIVQSAEKEAQPGMLRIITPDMQDGAMPDLATPEGQTHVNACLGQSKLVIVDNLSCLVRRGGRENEAESWLAVAEWALALRQKGVAVLFVHHAGKNGQQRGTSKREDLLDAVITLRHPPEYQPAQGAVFEVHFEKARALVGSDVQPFEAALTVGSDNRATWAIRQIEDSTLDRVVRLAGEGLKRHEIADELGVNRSTITRAWRKAQAQGLISKGGKRDDRKGVRDD